MSGVPDVVVHMLEAHVGAHVVLNVQDGVHDVPVSRPPVHKR